jgi:DNA-binding NarL/FixJ family response regulator
MQEATRRPKDTTGMTHPPSSVWVWIETTQEVVTLGLRTILETTTGPFHITTTGPTGDEPDVVLYDVIHLRDGDDSGLDYWLTETASTVIAIDRTLRPELGARAKEKGVEWAIDLGITADELVAVIRDAITRHLEDNPAAQEWDAGGYPGSEHGLSPRESDVLGLVAAGLSNHEIADSLFLSINSVKTYIRSAYRKMGVATRSQAVLWAIQHGFPNPEVPHS